jgi:hypothetical protein
MSRMRFAGLAMLLCVASCGGAPPAAKAGPDPACTTFRHLYLSDAAIDAMSHDDLKQVVAHNRTWDALCSRM